MLCKWSSKLHSLTKNDKELSCFSAKKSFSNEKVRILNIIYRIFFQKSKGLR